MWSGNFIFAGYCVLNSRSEAVEETSYFGSIYLQKMNRTQRSVGSVDSEHIGQQYCSWSSSSLAKDILRTNITIDTCSFLVSARQFNFVHQRQVCFCSTFPETNEGLYLFEEVERRPTVYHLQLLWVVMWSKVSLSCRSWQSHVVHTSWCCSCQRECS